MKKFYTLALAALCSLGAMAGPTIPFKTLPESSFKNFKAANSKATKTITPAAVSIADVVGDYDWYYMSLFTGDNITGQAEVKLADDGVSFVISMYEPEEDSSFEIKATWSKLKGAVQIPQQVIAQTTDPNTGITYDVYFSNASYTNANGPVISSSAAEGKYDSETGSIVFDNDTFFAVYYIYEGEYIWVAFTAYNTFDVHVDWTDLGMYEFKESFISTMAGVETEPEQVQVYEHPDYPGYYRIMAPWKKIYDSEQNLEVYLTDPEYGIIPFMNTKVHHEVEDSDVKIVSMSYVYAYMTKENLDKEAFLAKYGARNIYYDADAKKIIFPENCIAYNLPDSSKPNLLFIMEKSFAGYLDLSGDGAAIDNVAVDSDDNAPVEYYNLQGVKISNPEAGQVVIRRQGSKSSKVFVK